MRLLYLSFAGGGLDTNVRVLAPEFVRAGHCVSILYIHPPGERIPIERERSDAGYSIYHTISGAWHYYASRLTLGRSGLPRLVRSWEEARALGKIVRQIKRTEGLDLVELPEVFVTPSQLDGVPYAVRLHSAAWTWREMLSEPTGSADRIEKRLEAYVLRRASAISSPSVRLANYVRQTCRVDRPVTLIPYPVDTTQFTPGTGRAGPPIVLYVGRVEKRKGADVLMHAIPQVGREHPNCEFVFAGRVCDDVRELAQQMEKQMPERVRFLGVVPRGELVGWYQRASIFVAPSRWDNSPNTVYEAVACGTPVVASGVGGIPELIDDETGLLIPPGDPMALSRALVALLDDPERRDSMGRRGREKALALYSLEKILISTLEFYNQALVRHDAQMELQK